MELSNSPSWYIYCRSLSPEVSHLLRNRDCLLSCHKPVWQVINTWHQMNTAHVIAPYFWRSHLRTGLGLPTSRFLKRFRLNPCLIYNISHAYSTQIIPLDSISKIKCFGMIDGQIRHPHCAFAFINLPSQSTGLHSAPGFKSQPEDWLYSAFYSPTNAHVEFINTN